MSTEKAGNPRPFDVKVVEYLVELMARHDLAEIALQEGEHKVRLRKAGPPPVMVAPQAAYPVQPPAPQNPGANTPGSPPPAPTPAGKALHEIKAELVGSFFTRPGPGKEPFVKVGSVVKPDTPVCVIVAMKVNNEITAGCNGKIAEVCLKDEDFVEFGTVLFRVEPS